MKKNDLKNKTTVEDLRTVSKNNLLSIKKTLRITRISVLYISKNKVNGNSRTHSTNTDITDITYTGSNNSWKETTAQIIVDACQIIC